MNDWVQGCLSKLKLRNFVTYDYVEFTAGPHLNIIIGPNGTGKSSIVCALCLGLGGKTNLLGRAREVGEFVKHGADQASIELQLYNKRGNNHVIKRVITREDNRSQWYINNKVSNLKEVSSLVKQLNIDVDNLCQFLPQDMVAEFAKMSPPQLLESTERAVGGQELLNLHKSLITYKQEYKTIATAQGNKEEYLEELTKRNDYLKDIVSKHKERNKFLKKIEILERKRPWLMYEMQRINYNKLRDEKKTLLNRVEELKKLAQPLQDAVETSKTNLVEAESDIKIVSDELNQVHTKIRKIEVNIASIKDTIEETMQDFKVKQKEQETKERKLNELQTEVKAYESELGKLKPNSELKLKRDALTNESRSIAREFAKTESTMNEIVAEKQAQESRRRQIENQIQKLNDVRNKKLEMLRRYEKDTYKAVEWLRLNKDQFKGRVLEPFQLIINVPNQANAKYIESIISRNDRKAFIFERSDDLNMFMSELRDKQKLTINAVLAPQNANFSSQFDWNALRSLGFVGYLSDLIECPELAKRYLCRYYRIHAVPVGSASVDRNAERINQIMGSGLYFSPTNRYHISKSRYSDDTISSISQLRESKIFSLTVDMNRIQELTVAMENLRKDTESFDLRLKSVSYAMFLVLILPLWIFYVIKV